MCDFGSALCHHSLLELIWSIHLQVGHLAHVWLLLLPVRPLSPGKIIKNIYLFSNYSTKYPNKVSNIYVLYIKMQNDFFDYIIIFFFLSINMQNNVNAKIAMNGLLVTLALLEGFVAVWSAVLCCGAACCGTPTHAHSGVRVNLGQAIMDLAYMILSQLLSNNQL